MGVVQKTAANPANVTMELISRSLKLTGSMCTFHNLSYVPQTTLFYNYYFKYFLFPPCCRALHFPELHSI